MDRYEIADQRRSSEKLMYAIGNCFFIIALLSLFSTIFSVAQIEVYYIYFIFGLGVTQFVDSLIFYILVPALGTGGYVIGITINLIIVGLFIFLGYLGGQKKVWPFVIGIVLYALDIGFFVMVEDFISVFFHIMMLLILPWGIYSVKKLKKAERMLNELDM